MNIFENRTALITGGSSGLGLGLARALLERDAHVILLARNEEKLTRARSDLIKSFPTSKVSILSSDVTDRDALEVSLNKELAGHASLDIAINSAGVLQEGRFDQIPATDFERLISINCFGVANVTRVVLPYLIQSQGRLVNIASVAGLVGVYGYTSYCASKHALVGFTEALRYELKSERIKVHLVCPPEFESPMVEDIDTYRSTGNAVHVKMIPRLDLDRVVRDTIHGIEKNRFAIIPGWRTGLAMRAMQHFPAVGRWLADRRITDELRGSKR